MKPSFFTAILAASLASQAADIYPLTYEGYIPSYSSPGDVLTVNAITGPSYGTLVWAPPSGGTPAADVVRTVDSTADLISSSANVIITLGYYAAGDGGGAAYQLDTGSAAATNTVTVFEASTGRYLLMQNGAISAKQAGAVGDSTTGADGTDDHDALQALLDACVGGVARIDPATYRSAGGLTIPDDVKIIGRDAWVTLQTTGEPGLLIGSRCTIDGGRWTGARQSGGANGYNNSTIAFGVYTSAGSVSNSVVKNVRLEMTGYAASAIIITGASHDIVVDNLEFGNSATVECVVLVHWGYVSGSETNGTLHPYNIHVSNVSVGNLTSGTAEASAVSCAAGYNVLFENIRVGTARYGTTLNVGDFGFKYSGLIAQTLGSVVLRNFTCLNASNIGVLFQGLGTGSIQYPQQFLVENSTVFGPNDSSNNGGLYFSGSVNATVRNTLVAGHSQGTVFTSSAKNTIIDTCTFTTNYLAAVVVDNAGTDGVTVVNSKMFNNGRGVSGANSAGVRLVNGSNARVSGCTFGGITEPNQETGITVVGTFVNAVLTDNYVTSVDGAGTGYNLGSGSDTGHVAMFSNNRAAAGITLFTAPANIPYLQRGSQRTFTGTATPTVGTYIVGDMVIFDTAVSTPFAKVCSVAGTPGTWVTAY